MDSILSRLLSRALICGCLAESSANAAPSYAKIDLTSSFGANIFLISAASRSTDFSVVAVSVVTVVVAAASFASVIAACSASTASTVKGVSVAVVSANGFNSSTVTSLMLSVMTSDGAGADAEAVSSRS